MEEFVQMSPFLSYNEIKERYGMLLDCHITYGHEPKRYLTRQGNGITITISKITVHLGGIVVKRPPLNRAISVGSPVRLPRASISPEFSLHFFPHGFPRFFQGAED